MQEAEVTLSIVSPYEQISSNRFDALVSDSMRFDPN